MAARRNAEKLGRGVAYSKYYVSWHARRHHRRHFWRSPSTRFLARALQAEVTNFNITFGHAVIFCTQSRYENNIGAMWHTNDFAASSSSLLAFKRLIFRLNRRKRNGNRSAPLENRARRDPIMSKPKVALRPAHKKLYVGGGSIK